jgi:hypothetical protein
VLGTASQGVLILRREGVNSTMPDRSSAGGPLLDAEPTGKNGRPSGRAPRETSCRRDGCCIGRPVPRRPINGAGDRRGLLRRAPHDDLRDRRTTPPDTGFVGTSARRGADDVFGGRAWTPASWIRSTWSRLRDRAAPLGQRASPSAASRGRAWSVSPRVVRLGFGFRVVAVAFVRGSRLRIGEMILVCVRDLPKGFPLV